MSIGNTAQYVTETFITSIDDKYRAMELFYGHTKPFDFIKNELWLQQLALHDIAGDTHKVLKYFLANRKQRLRSLQPTKSSRW